MGNEKVGLVLEGGGLRGVFTAGVLDLFMDKDYYAGYAIGVSAGACQIFSYLSRQRGRSFRVSADYLDDPRYLSYRSLITKGEIFGMDFMFDEIPNKLLPFDYEQFNGAPEEFVAGVTNCQTGLSEYFSNKDGHDMYQIARASSSLPVFSKTVDLYGKPYLDGGVTDPIPIRKAEADGCQRNIIVLTRDKTYYKKDSRHAARLVKGFYRAYPELAKAYEKRPQVYNDTLRYIEDLEKSGRAFVIRPQKPVVLGRTEKNKEKLRSLYQDGYAEAKRLWDSLENWLK